MRVLVAADDRAIGLALKMALEDLGHECLVAEDGNRALELYRERGADVIISDWRMPGLEGPELCRLVREQAPMPGASPYVYFILLTVLNEQHHILAGMQAGADDYLTKPFALDALQAKLIAAERIVHLHQRLADHEAERIRIADGEHQQLSAQIDRERSQIQAILRQLLVGVVIASAPSGEITMVNEQVAQIWRVPSPNQGFPIRQWRGFHPDGQEYTTAEWPLMRAIASGEVTVGEEVDILRGDGTRGTIRITAAPIQEGDQTIAAVSIHFDITDERRHQREVAQNEKLRALGQMAGGVAHDLNQSLALVSGYAEIARTALEQPVAPAPAEVIELLQIITQAAYDGGETVKRLLTFSRAPAESAPEIVDLSVLLEDVAKLTAPRWRDAAQAEGRPIALQIRAEAGVTIEGWPAALREALTNLIFNAVDALPGGGRINLLAQVAGAHVQIDVTDSGAGIPAEIHDRVFEPFFTTKGILGTGLGLAMVFGIVERHQGRVRVESAPGQGTTIRMEFRLPSFVPQTVDESGSGVCIGRRILLVDDHAAIRMMVTRILSEHGHTMHAAESAEDALALLESQSFDVLLTDVGLGTGMNGWQLATEARTRWPNMQVVLGTGWAASIDPEAARTLGIARIIAKPYRSTDLAEAIDSL